MRLVLLVVLLVFGASGCAGTRLYSSMLERGGALRMSEPDDKSHDYKFYIKAAVDVGLDTQKQEDRILLIKGYLEATCSDIDVVSDTFLPAGGVSVLGFPMGTYVMKIKCVS